MSTREKAIHIFNLLSEEQLAAFVTLFGGVNNIEEEELDEWDKAMIRDSAEDNAESMPLDEFARKLGLNPDDLRI